MRTTLNLNDELVRQAKQRAAAEDRTLTSVIEDALRRLLAGSAPPDRRSRHKLQLLTPSELQPRLDPNDPVFYRDVLEQEDIEKYGPQARAPSSSTDASL